MRAIHKRHEDFSARAQGKKKLQRHTRRKLHVIHRPYRKETGRRLHPQPGQVMHIERAGAERLERLGHPQYTMESPVWSQSLHALAAEHRLRPTTNAATAYRIGT